MWSWNASKAFITRVFGSRLHISRDSTCDEQDGIEIVGVGRQPEAAAGLAGAGCHALEGAAVGSRAGADELGADGLLVAVATDEDGVAAGIGVEDAILAATLEQGGVKPAGRGQEVTHGVPEAVCGGWQAQGVAASGWTGWRMLGITLVREKRSALIRRGTVDKLDQFGKVRRRSKKDKWLNRRGLQLQSHYNYVGQ